VTPPPNEKEEASLHEEEEEIPQMHEETFPQHEDEEPSVEEESLEEISHTQTEDVQPPQEAGHPSSAGQEAYLEALLAREEYQSP
jgi:hypothetical protein